MRYSMINGEAVEIDYLGSSSEGLDRVYLKWGIKLYDINGLCIYADQYTALERPSARRRGRYGKLDGAEKALAWLRTSEVMYDWSYPEYLNIQLIEDRAEAVMELLIELGRRRRS